MRPAQGLLYSWARYDAGTQNGQAWFFNRDATHPYMTPRRFVALVLAGSLLHLTSIRADAACAQHGEYAGQSAPVPEETAERGGHHDHAGAAPSSEECDTPTLPACCQMLVSCSTILDNNDALRHDATRTHAGVAAALQSMPQSRVATPDPPPPRH